MHRRAARGVRASACPRQLRPVRGRVPAQRPVRSPQGADGRLGRVHRLIDRAATGIVLPEPPAAERGRGAVPPEGERLEANRGRRARLAGDVVQPVGVGRYGAVAQPRPHPRRRAPAAAPARVAGSGKGSYTQRSTSGGFGPAAFSCPGPRSSSRSGLPSFRPTRSRLVLPRLPAAPLTGVSRGSAARGVRRRRFRGRDPIASEARFT